MQIYQITPQVWRIFSITDKVTSSWEEPFTLHDLLLCYEIRVKAKNRVSLHVRVRKDALVDGIQSNDKVGRIVMFL